MENNHDMSEQPSVSRQEFESHRQQVSKDVANLADAIRAEGVQRSRDTQTLRDDIKTLASSSGRPQYQALGFAFGVFSFVCLGIAGVFAWGADAKWEAAAQALKSATVLEEALSQSRHDVQQVQIDRLTLDIEKLTETP
jgi:hypothetical protein